MSRIRFDSSQLLPLFKIVSPKTSTNGSMEETKKEGSHLKKSKLVEVPVHSHHVGKIEKKPSILKLRKSKHKNEKIKHEDEEITRRTPKEKVSRTDILLENDKLFQENQKIIKRLAAVEHSLAKKETSYVKLQEKFSDLIQHFEQLQHENEQIRKDNDKLSENFDMLKRETEEKCTNCELLKKALNKSNAELSDIKTINKEMDRDMDMLKNVIYRLNVQVERYQQKLQQMSSNQRATSPEQVEIQILDDQNNETIKLPKTKDIVAHKDHIHTPLSWGSVNTHTLGPLLDAYQETINEKMEIINNYENELAKFTNKMKLIIEENELLHGKIMEEREKVEKYYGELMNNRDELKTIKEQNELLLKKCSVKQDKVQEICRVYDHKLESMQRDRDILQEEYHKVKSDLFDLQEKFDVLSRNHNTLLADKQSVIPLEVHNLGVNECRRLFEELKTKYDLEKSKLTNQVKHFEEELQELNKKLIEVTAEKQEMQIRLKSAEKHAKKSENRLMETQKALSQVKLSRDSCKRQLSKAIEFGRELVTEQESLLRQLTTKQRENKSVKEIGSSIVSRMDVLKTQLKSVQKNAFQQLASVEQRLHEQDSSMESMRRSHESELEKMSQELKEKDEFISKLLEQNGTLSGTQYLLYREKHMHLS